jgi:hypothetical protein
MRAVSSLDVAPGDWVGEAEGRHRFKSYFGGRSGPSVEPGPQGFLVEYPDPKAVVKPHFHAVPQFQVIVRATRLGKRPIGEFSMQYADPYTPYGPIVGTDEGLAFFTLRSRQSTGTFYMPGSRDKLLGKPGRNLAIDYSVADPPAEQEPFVRETLLEPTADGMQAVRIRMRPGAEAPGIDATSSGGQYYLVTEGSVHSGGKELPRLSLIWVEAGEPAPSLRAGESGASVLAMQFPVPQAVEQPAAAAATASATSRVATSLKS